MKEQAKHTPGAIRAAEIITGGYYGDGHKYATNYGNKTVKGIADLIDRETHAPELLTACKLAVARLEMNNYQGEENGYMRIIDQAINRAEGN